MNGGYYSVDFKNNLVEYDKTPEYYFISPNQQFRINTEFPNMVKEDYTCFIKKWNKSTKKYERLGDLFSVYGLGLNMFWIDNKTVLLTIIPFNNDDVRQNFYELKITENGSDENNKN